MYVALNQSGFADEHRNKCKNSRAMARANPRRSAACQFRAAARRRLLSIAAALTDVTTRDFVVALSISERAAPPAQLYTSTVCTRVRGGGR